MLGYAPFDTIPPELSFEVKFRHLRQALKLTRMKEGDSLLLLGADQLAIQTIGTAKLQAVIPYSLPPSIDAGRMLGLATRLDTLVYGLVNESSAVPSEVVRFTLKANNDRNSGFLEIAWGSTTVRQHCIIALRYTLIPPAENPIVVKVQAIAQSFRALTSLVRPAAKGEAEPAITISNKSAEMFQLPFYSQWADDEIDEKIAVSFDPDEAALILPNLKDWDGDELSISATDGQIYLHSKLASYQTTARNVALRDVSTLLVHGRSVTPILMSGIEFVEAVDRICSQAPRSPEVSLLIKADVVAATLQFEINCGDGLAKLDCNVQIDEDHGNAGQTSYSAFVSPSAIRRFAKACFPVGNLEIRFIEGALLFEEHAENKRRLSILATQTKPPTAAAR